MSRLLVGGLPPKARAFAERAGMARGAAVRRASRALRPDLLAARLGASAAWQMALLPGDIADLVQQVLLVETGAVKWGGKPPRRYRNRGLAILGGDWDTCCRQPVESYLSSQEYGLSIHEMFVEGRPYNETTQYERMVDRLARGGVPKGCTTMAEIHAYFRRLDTAYRSIEAEGYKTQAELGTGTMQDEIMVYVDRDGELHKQQGSGHHRLAIARLLGIPHVPVCLLGVHRLWVERCYRRFGHDVVSALGRGLSEELSANHSLMSDRSSAPYTATEAEGGGRH